MSARVKKSKARRTRSVRPDDRIHRPQIRHRLTPSACVIQVESTQGIPLPRIKSNVHGFIVDLRILCWSTISGVRSLASLSVVHRRRNFLQQGTSYRSVVEIKQPPHILLLRITTLSQPRSPLFINYLTTCWYYSHKKLRRRGRQPGLCCVSILNLICSMLIYIIQLEF